MFICLHFLVLGSYVDIVRNSLKALRRSLHPSSTTETVVKHAFFSTHILEENKGKNKANPPLPHLPKKQQKIPK